MSETFDVTLSDVTPGAAMDALLAIEYYAERFFEDRRTNPERQERYNALAAVVLPLRAAMDSAVAS